MLDFQLLIEAALGIAVKIPDLRACAAIRSTDCRATLAKTDCNEKPGPQGNAQNNDESKFFDFLNEM